VALNDGDTDEVLRNKTVCPTGRGLLLVRDPDTMDTFLLRPQDGDRIHLPPLVGIDDGELMHSHCLLSDEPSAPGCVLLLVEGVADNSMWYCHPGDDDDRWVKYEYDIGTMTLPHEYEGSKYMKITICSIAACRGKFYFNGTPEELGVLDFCPGPVFSSIAIDDSFDSDEEEGDDQGYEEEPGRRRRRVRVDRIPQSRCSSWNQAASSTRLTCCTPRSHAIRSTKASFRGWISQRGGGATSATLGVARFFSRGLTLALALRPAPPAVGCSRTASTSWRIHEGRRCRLSMSRKIQTSCTALMKRRHATKRSGCFLLLAS